jgi:acyl transferase domain-containing protein
VTSHTVPDDSTAIAVIGMAGRFPGAPDLASFWRNLREGTESISFFSKDELRARGTNLAILDDPRFVGARAVLDEADLFDANFFGYTPREAQLMDPQQRLFLECGSEALEDAGYDPDTYPGMIGVYAGVSVNSYLLSHFATNPEVALSLGTDKDFIASRLSYKLNLRGPSVVVQTACSTSLVAICHACQALLDYHCDIAISGAASVSFPQRSGYLHVDGGILSPDGHCRAFDASSKGTVGGDGIGVVVLKRLADALNDGDHIHAVVRGFALNNDGAMKIGYTAPSVDGQAQVIAMAQSIGGIDADTINYVEAHGTGTTLGDPIEIAALTKAFRASTRREGYCAIGSVKTNIGHLDAAAGVAGFIKTVLALKHREIPPSLHFEQPNPKIDFAHSPFFVNTKLTPWTPGVAGKRRAGVSSFGIGGTNAHVVLEEAPAPAPAAAMSRPWHVLTLSARTPSALESASARLADRLAASPEVPLADAAFTLQAGRRTFPHRRAVLCRSVEDARAALASGDPRRVIDRVQEAGDRPVVFMFPGQGTQRLGMGRGLYETEPEYAKAFDTCAEAFSVHAGFDLRAAVYPAAGAESPAADLMRRTGVTQAALFATEYAMATLWMSWGVRPQAMIGHSIGEYVAATLSGVLALDDAIALVAERGRLMDQSPAGVMLSVHLPASDVTPMLGEGLWLAAINGPSLCVVSGEPDEIDALEESLETAGTPCQRLQTSTAFHSGLMANVVAPLTAAARRIRIGQPSIPYISNVSGTWITAADLADREYWGRQAREAVQFARGVTELTRFGARVFLEVGPGQVLSTLVRHSFATMDGGDQATAIPSLPYTPRDADEQEQLAGAVARMWLNGAPPMWAEYHGVSRRRVPLPTYPFERKRYFVTRPAAAAAAAVALPSARLPIDDWFHIPSWKRTVAPRRASAPARALVFAGASGTGADLARELSSRGTDVIVVSAGERFEWISDSRCALRPRLREDYDRLVARLREDGRWPDAVAHTWGVGGSIPASAASQTEDDGFWSTLFLVQALADASAPPTALTVVTAGVHDVTGTEDLDPLKAAVLGLCRVAPQEFPGLRCRHVDFDPAAVRGIDGGYVDELLVELTSPSTDASVAYRGIDRWVYSLEAAALPAAPQTAARIRPRGVYLITGGLRGLGLVFAKYLANTAAARLVLTSRSGAADADSIRELERLGAEVMVAAADVTDEARMREVVQEARARFGTIDGVVHSAGVPGGGLIQLRSAEAASAVLAAKIAGTLVLERVLGDAPLDFVVLCSSLTSIVGGVGQVDYCAANAFLDAYARMRTTRHGVPTMAINWDAWADTGMALHAALPEAFRKAHEAAVRAGITSEEGAEVFARALSALPLPQLVVAVRKPSVVTSAVPAAAAPVSAPAAAPEADAPSNPRPRLSQPYVAPSDDVERGVCALWEALIGIRPIGVNDSFFELGGHSLLAIQVMAKLNTHYATAIPVARLYEGLTPGFLAGLIREQLSPAEDERETAPSSREPLPHREQLRRRRLQARRTQERTV